MTWFQTARQAIRLRTRRSILQLGKIRRIHILGAARSGTTLIHCAMSAFDETTIHPRESNLNHPTLTNSMRIGIRNLMRRANLTYVTKRGYGWFNEELLHAFCADAIAGQYGVIYMVRDPADVLTSRHRGEQTRTYYLEPERWAKSVHAGEFLRKKLGDKTSFLTLRYEDLVREPELVRKRIEDEFGLKLRPSVSSWSDLGSNVDPDSLGDLATALHSIRSFDESSIGKWKNDEELCRHWKQLLTSEIGDELATFGQTHGYESVNSVVET